MELLPDIAYFHVYLPFIVCKMRHNLEGFLDAWVRMLGLVCCIFLLVNVIVEEEWNCCLMWQIPFLQAVVAEVAGVKGGVKMLFIH